MTSLLVFLVVSNVAQGQPRPPFASLKTVTPPAPANLNQYVRDARVLVALGKALFWDLQVGSDGQTACATCHFHAGADHRLQNQLSSPHDKALAFRPNATLSPADFPFRKLADPLNSQSAVVRDTRQVMGSAGVIYRRFLDLGPGGAEDGLEEAGPAAFAVNGIKVRQVTPRNTPSVINSIYYVRNFWDGRASDIFTGMTPFGESDSGFHAVVLKDGRLETERVRMENASLASQAVGPVLNEVEMSYDGRTWQKFARKILEAAPLARQRVASDDSVLGAMANPDGPGLGADYSYAALMRAAFRPEYWQSEERDGNGMLQMERNLPLFFGLAVQAYEATLISDETRYDRFLEGDRAALTRDEQDGFTGFAEDGSECHHCHQGPELTAASFTNFNLRRQAGGNPALPDVLGFFRTAVSPIEEDLGGGARDTFGRPLFDVGGGQARGVFKSPGLRNVELTGPYFHDGGQATLEQVVEFYARRGDFPGDGNLGTGMGNIRLSARDRETIPLFLKALTDERVRFERAPFDHPELCVPVGHVESAPGALELDAAIAGSRSGADRWALIRAVGRGGNRAPLQTFEELLRGIGNDGSREHTLTEACSPR